MKNCPHPCFCGIAFEFSFCYSLSRFTVVTFQFLLNYILAELEIHHANGTHWPYTNVGKTFPNDRTDELMCNVQKCMESVRKKREDKNPMKIYIFPTWTSERSGGTLNTNIWTKFVFTIFWLQHANCTYGFIQWLHAGATISE